MAGRIFREKLDCGETGCGWTWGMRVVRCTGPVNAVCRDDRDIGIECINPLTQKLPLASYELDFLDEPSRETTGTLALCGAAGRRLGSCRDIGRYLLARATYPA
jgi:hypothetical protein